MSHAYRAQTFTRHPVSLMWLALAALMLASACSQTATDIPLATLVAQQAGYDGQNLTTSGIVRTFDEPRHYWI